MGFWDIYRKYNVGCVITTNIHAAPTLNASKYTYSAPKFLRGMDRDMFIFSTLKVNYRLHR
jgi:hypothetical protein